MNDTPVNRITAKEARRRMRDPDAVYIPTREMNADQLRYIYELNTAVGKKTVAKAIARFCREKFGVELDRIAELSPPRG